MDACYNTDTAVINKMCTQNVEYNNGNFQNDNYKLILLCLRK